MLTWEELKAKGNSLYRLCHYEEALEQYTLAIAALQGLEASTTWVAFTLSSQLIILLREIHETGHVCACICVSVSVPHSFL